MLFIFCNEPFEFKKVDSLYTTEAEAVIESGHRFTLIDFEALVSQHSATKAVRNVTSVETPCQAISRGWMMTVDQYAALYSALADRGL